MDESRFERVRELGSGAMGRVVLATERATRRAVAIKTLARQYLGHEEVLARFKREARIQSLIEHPHVVRIHEAAVDVPEPYLVMEYVDGTTLDETIKNAGALPLAAVLAMAEQVGSALDLLHGKGILHRDLKPSNVMVRRRDGTFVVMDLGLASLVDSTLLTSTGQLLGTPLYMPPEVILGKPWTKAGDLYQLGAILFEAAVGRRLVRARSIEDVLVEITAGDRSGFPTGPDALPKAMEEGLRRALAVDPADRPPSGRELAAALRTGAGPGSKPSRRLARPELAASAVGAGPPGAAPRSLGRGPALGLALAGLAALVAGAMSLGPVGPDEIRWDVVGDAVVASWASPGPPGVVLQVDGVGVAAETSPVEGRSRAVARGLEPGREVEVRLGWPGGRTDPRRLRAESPAVLPGLRLAEAGMVRVETLRPVTAYWQGRTAEQFPLEPGSQRIPLPPGAPDTFTLVWSEARVPFERTYTRHGLFEDEVRALEERLGTLDPVREVQERVGLGKSLGSGLAVPRAALRPLGGWVGEILASGLPRERRARFFALHQAWDRSVAMERSEGGPNDPIAVPIGLPGSRFAGSPTWDPAGAVSVRPALEGVGGEYEPGDPRGIPLGLTEGKALLIGSRAAKACEAVRFTWPAAAPADTRPMFLSLGVHKMASSLVLRVTGEGPVPPLELWHPAPGLPPPKNLTDQLHVCLPADLMPAPGSPVEIRLLPLIRSTGELLRLTEVVVSWPR